MLATATVRDPHGTARLTCASKGRAQAANPSHDAVFLSTLQPPINRTPGACGVASCIGVSGYNDYLSNNKQYAFEQH